MLRQEHYERASEIFGCSIGVAGNITYKTKEESEGSLSVEEFRQLDDEIGVNRIIIKAIESDQYPTLRREILREERNKNPRLKEITLYKRVYGKTRTESREIH